MNATRTPRPTDLVALVTFDEDVRENLAVTRERLALAKASPMPVAAAIQQWLHLGRRMWVSVAGRQIRGIATARDLTAKCAWEIDTLIEDDEPATGDARNGHAVLLDLLRQAAIAAQDAEATHLLLRTPEDSLAAEVAVRAGFAPVQQERLWTGRIATRSTGDLVVRDWTEADTFASFQVHCRAVPVAARQAMAMTLDEWTAVRDRHWQERGDRALVVEQDGRVVGTARTARAGGQFTLSIEPGADAAADALLAAVGRILADSERQITLVATCGGTEEAALRRAGMIAETETYALYCRRMQRPLREETYARAGIPITGA